MHAASHIIAKLIEGCIWFVNKFGINGFLVILLVIEIPVVYVASDSIGSGYRGARNYKIKNVDEETVRQNCPDMDYDEENHYYLVTAYLTNFYGEEMRYALLHAQNQEGDYLVFEHVPYYDTAVVNHYGLSNRDVVPAGVTKPYHYILELTDFELEHTSEVILKETGENDATIAFSLPH